MSHTGRSAQAGSSSCPSGRPIRELSAASRHSHIGQPMESFLKPNSQYMAHIGRLQRTRGSSGPSSEDSSPSGPCSSLESDEESAKHTISADFYTVFQKKRHPFYFYNNFVRCRPTYLILVTIIGQSIYNVAALTYLLETEIFSIVKYQLKCCSVANDAAPDCYMVWSGAACCRQGHRWVSWMAARLCESWWTTLELTLSVEVLFRGWEAKSCAGLALAIMRWSQWA